jgi:arsenite/tail-anchored protein-transporting ATPase
VNGFDNLSAMEIDPNSALQEMVEQCIYAHRQPFLHCSQKFTTDFLADSNGVMGSMMQDLAFAIPGVDEAMSFAEIMKSVPSTPSNPPLRSSSVLAAK